MTRKRKQFCSKRHDIFVVGRNRHGVCNQCYDMKLEGDRVTIDRRTKNTCHKGHDISLVGRNVHGICNKCQGEKHPPVLIDKRKKRLCPKGHDKDVVGRTKDGMCSVCQKEYQTNYYATYGPTYYANNKEKILTQKKIYYDENRDEIVAKKVLYEAKKIIIDPQFKLIRRLRSRIRLALRGNYKSGSAVRDLGCTIEFLKSHIESKFYTGMTWGNWGTVWELDHIVPLFKFNLSDREQFLKACNYTNLQPLTVAEHRKKTNKEISDSKKKHLVK